MLLGGGFDEGPVGLLYFFRQRKKQGEYHNLLQELALILRVKE